MSKEAMNERDSEQQKFQFFYRNYADDIENTKRRQWAIPYYILLLFAAIIWIRKVGVSSPEEKLLLTILAFIVSLLGIWHILDVHFVQAKYRRKLHRLANDNSQFVYEYTKPDSSDLRATYYLPQFTYFFVGIVISGFVFVLLSFNLEWQFAVFCVIVLIIYCYLIYRKKRNKLNKEEPLLKETNTKNKGE